MARMKGLVVRRGVEVPGDVIDVGVGVISEAGLSGQIAAQPTVGVLDRAALPRAARAAEVGAQTDRLGDDLVSRELAAIVVGDGAAGRGRQAAQLRSDGFGGELGVFGS
ncbi:MAG TPA: hypothetical protein VFJ13_02690 [Paracoccaceae bacterium]|nr:hypothetical protein [Paracoccaceae bacterium]